MLSNRSEDYASGRCEVAALEVVVERTQIADLVCYICGNHSNTLWFPIPSADFAVVSNSTLPLEYKAFAPVHFDDC